MGKSGSKKHPKKLTKAERSKQLIGLGGWLMFYIIGLSLALVITIFNFFYDGFISSFEINALNEYQSGLGDTLQTFTAVESFAVVIYIALMIATLVLLIRKSNLAKTFAITTLLFGAVYSTLDYLIASSIFNSSGLAQNADVSKVINQAGVNAGRAIIGAVIWIPYFLVSKRVASTLAASSGDKHLKTLTPSISFNSTMVDSFKRYSLMLTAALFALAITFVLLGGVFFETWEKTIQDYRPATYRTEKTGKMNITFSGSYICGGGYDYLSCINQHVTAYNTICTNQDLTVSASATCAELLDFINQIKSRYQSCGYNCKTIADSNGKWGWQYLILSPETRQFANDDEQKKITQTAVCIARIGNLKIGACQEN